MAVVMAAIHKRLFLMPILFGIWMYCFLADVDYGSSGAFTINVWFKHDQENFEDYQREQFFGHGNPFVGTAGSPNQLHWQFEKSGNIRTLTMDGTDATSADCAYCNGGAGGSAGTEAIEAADALSRLSEPGGSSRNPFAGKPDVIRDVPVRPTKLWEWIR